jgi:hypothetical protein
MSDWIDFTIAMAFLFTLWVLVPRFNVGYTAALMVGRNPELLARRPDWQKSLHDNRWFLWGCYGMGALSIAALVSLRLGLWSLDQVGWVVPTHIAKDGRGLVALSALVSALVQLGWVSLFMMTWQRRLPLTPRRRATLDVRQFGAHVPSWLWALAVSLMALSLAASAAFAALGGSESRIRWIGFVGQALYLLALLGGALWSVRRRPNLIDSYFGPRYRRYETRGFVWSIAILSALNLLILGVWKLGHVPDPFYFYDLMLLLLPGMFLAGIIWNKLNAPKQARDQGGRERAL